MSKPVQASSYTFRTLIEGGYLYVDKTHHLYDLIHNATGVYFLSRPRRFGKSLMVSTLSEIFQGNKELFQGLWIYESDYNWQTYPVIHIDFSRYGVKSATKLEQFIDYFLDEIARRHDLTLRGFDYQTRFDNLIQQLGQQSQIVLLIDEYDKPLIDNLTDLPSALEIRDVLRNFYSIVKAMDQYIRFVFITGISKFSKVGVFSTMNHLDDLTFDPRFATVLGITEEELRTNFQEYIVALAKQENLSEEALLQKICAWYDGFCFVGGGLNVYNPFSTLQLFNKRYFSNYWFETGTPTFLIELLKKNQYPLEQLENLRLRELAFSTFEIESLSVIPLLFQTGYLTIKGYEKAIRRYTLSYPNAEVKDAFLAYLLDAFNYQDRSFNEAYLWQLIDALQEKDLQQFFAVLEVFFANIPYDIQLKYEKYYQSLFYVIFKLIGLTIDSEVSTNQGRIDAVIELDDHIFLFEFKLDGSADDALQQINDTDYAQKYRLKGKPIRSIGANFDSEQRKITDWRLG